MAPKTRAELDEIQRRIRAGEVRIEMAPNDATLDLSVFVDRIVVALGFKPENVLVTDLSSVGDFIDWPDDPKERSKVRDEAFAALSQKLDLRLSAANDDDNYIVRIAYKLRQRSQRGASS